MVKAVEAVDAAPLTAPRFFGFCWIHGLGKGFLFRGDVGNDGGGKLVLSGTKWTIVDDVFDVVAWWEENAPDSHQKEKGPA